VKDLLAMPKGHRTEATLLARCLQGAASQNEVVDFIRDRLVRVLTAHGAPDLEALLRHLRSPHRDDRAHVGHLLGHVAKYLGQGAVLAELRAAYDAEKDPWVKRSLALANGRAGQGDVVNEYVLHLLPRREHRFVNLSYHIEYYGSATRAVVAVLSHLCLRRQPFLRDLDIFTLRQFAAQEQPLREQDRGLGMVLCQRLPMTESDENIARAAVESDFQELTQQLLQS
jgi:hypothetical protein